MKLIEADIWWASERSKIAAIKAWRRATGCGLAEAKHFIERADNQWTRVRITAEAFGLLVLEILEDGDRRTCGRTGLEYTNAAVYAQTVTTDNDFS